MKEKSGEPRATDLSGKIEDPVTRKEARAFKQLLDAFRLRLINLKGYTDARENVREQLSIERGERG